MLLLFIAAAGIGVSKSGFAGVSMLHVLLFAEVFGSKPSTGALLPMLVTGDIIAIFFFGKKVDWTQVRKLLPASMLGVMVGALAMNYLKGPIFDFVVGLIILVLASMQTARTVQPGFFDKLPHETSFAFTLGFLAGVATMMANAAGPIVALYLLAVGMPKLELVACSAWFFLDQRVQAAVQCIHGIDHCKDSSDQCAVRACNSFRDLARSMDAGSYSAESLQHLATGIYLDRGFAIARSVQFLHESDWIIG